MPESQVMANGMGEVSGQDVRLEDVDIHADADGLAAADRSNRRNCRPLILETLSAVTKEKMLLLLQSISNLKSQLIGRL